ncbi:MAG: hypothetical protein WCD53_11145 [Microcoleus sp.]
MVDKSRSIGLDEVSRAMGVCTRSKRFYQNYRAKFTHNLCACRNAEKERNLMENTLFNKVFRDREGKIVLAQMPNLPLMVWIVASLLKMIFTTGRINIGLDVLAFGSLFTWAWEELFQGVNYFRRALGFLVLVGLASKLQ